MLMASKTYNLNDVVTFKLVSGEEVVARVFEEHDSWYSLQKPMQLIPTPNQSIGLAPIAFSFDPQNFMMLNKHAVSMHGKTLKDLADQYLSNTTGLTIAR